MNILIPVIIAFGFGIGIGMMIASDMIDRQAKKRKKERIKEILQSPNGGINAPLNHT